MTAGGRRQEGQKQSCHIKSRTPSYKFSNSVTEIQFTYHKDHPLKVCMAFSIFTELCNYHHNLILERFHHPPKKPCTC